MRLVWFRVLGVRVLGLGFRILGFQGFKADIVWGLLWVQAFMVLWFWGLRGSE